MLILILHRENSGAESEIVLGCVVAPNRSGGGLTVGEFLEAAITGAGEGFQRNVIDPLGTAAGLAIYTNVPGSVTLGGAYGYGGYVSLSRDGDGRVGLIGAFGIGLGGKLEVTTNTPTLSNIQGTAPYLGLDSQGSTMLGGVRVGAGLNIYSSSDWSGNHSTVVSGNGSVEVSGTPLSFGGELRFRQSGNVNSGSLNGEFGGEGVSSAGAGIFIFSGAQGGVIFGPPKP